MTVENNLGRLPSTLHSAWTPLVRRRAPRDGVLDTGKVELRATRRTEAAVVMLHFPRNKSIIKDYTGAESEHLPLSYP